MVSANRVARPSAGMEATHRLAGPGHRILSGARSRPRHPRRNGTTFFAAHGPENRSSIEMSSSQPIKQGLQAGPGSGSSHLSVRSWRSPLNGRTSMPSRPSPPFVIGTSSALPTRDSRQQSAHSSAFCQTHLPLRLHSARRHKTSDSTQLGLNRSHIIHVISITRGHRCQCQLLGLENMIGRNHG